MLPNLTKNPGRRPALVCAVVALLFTGCGPNITARRGGGSGGAEPGGYLKVLGVKPGDDALQVSVDTSIEVTFDGKIHPDALNEEEFMLHKGDHVPIRGQFMTDLSGTKVIFTPELRLLPATDYQFEVAAQICDSQSRMLENPVHVGFRTFDNTGPKVVSSSVVDNAVDVSRTAAISVTFDERLDPNSVTTKTVLLLDDGNQPLAADVSSSGNQLRIRPAADLAGSKKFELHVIGGSNGVRDRSSNGLANDHRIGFTTEVDTTPPELVITDPDKPYDDVSPLARLGFEFSESLAPEARNGVELEDGQSNAIAATLSFSRDQRTAYLTPGAPLAVNQIYTVTLQSRPDGMTDVSGNPLAETYVRRFRVVDDITPPTVISTFPREAQQQVSPDVAVELQFGERLAAGSVNPFTVGLLAGSTVVTGTVKLTNQDTKIVFTPAEQLAADTSYTLRLVSGHDGVLDVHKNPMPADVELRFTTSSEQQTPVFTVYPGAAIGPIPITSTISVLANAKLAAESVTAENFRVEDRSAQAIRGKLELALDDRVIRFAPDNYLPQGSTITIVMRGGPDGIRLANGNWSRDETRVNIQTGWHRDMTKPEATVSINSIAQERTAGIIVPPTGFTIEIKIRDPWDRTIDPTTLQIELEGPDPKPTALELFEMAELSPNLATIRVTKPLTSGAYVLSATVKDLTGNVSDKSTVEFSVSPPDNGSLPFEHTQFVWVRFDTDRENGGKGDGTADFTQDLLDLGLMAKGDPNGTNEYMRKLVTDGVVARANDLFSRLASGAAGPDSVNIRLLTRQPCVSSYMKIAVGGNDPQGASGRKYGDRSTGILGRAWFDYRNGNPAEDDTITSPGLGVFLGELFLFQSKVYLDLYPFFVTRFGRRFRGLSPHMGGTPAGTDPVDKKVLSPGFDYDSASETEQARYEQVMTAADEIANSIGVILAHEIGHSVGLVAEGKPSRGLHGDASLHNADGLVGQVMNPVISYDSLVTIDFDFRGINLAYLRERILVK